MSSGFSTKKIAIVVGAIIVCALLWQFVVYPSSVVPKGTVKIGHILPISGPLSPYAEGFRNGVRMAVDQLNGEGGVGGWNFELIEEDTGTDAIKAAEAVRKLIDVDGVKVIVGAYASSCTMAAAPICEENKVVLVSPASTSPLVTDAGNYIFRVVPSDELQGIAMAQLALEKGYKTAGIIAINNQYGIGLEEVFKREFEKEGGSVVITVRYELGAASYKTELGQLKAANPDVIIDVSYADDGAIVFKQAKELGITSNWICAEGVADEAIFGSAGVADAMMGMIGTKPTTPTGSAENNAFLDAYNAKFGVSPGIYADYAYDAAMIAMRSVAKAASYDGEAIMQAMSDVGSNYKGVSGTKTFDSNGDVVGEYIIWEVQLVEGSYKMVQIGTWTSSEGVKLS